MRRFLKSKLSIVVLVLATISLITGVTLAATSPAPSSQEVTSTQEVKTSVVQIVPIPLTVGVGGRLELVGSGFKPDDPVLFRVIIGGGAPPIILEVGFANASGAYSAVNEALPEDLVSGLYTIEALTLESGGVPVATTPIIVSDK